MKEEEEEEVETEETEVEEEEERKRGGRGIERTGRFSRLLGRERAGLVES